MSESEMEFINGRINEAQIALGEARASLHRVAANLEPLTECEWAMLERFERALYRGEPGINSYTDVMPREEALWLRPLWDHCLTACEYGPGGESMTEAAREQECARRVARALGVIAWGPEWLIR